MYIFKSYINLILFYIIYFVQYFTTMKTVNLRRGLLDICCIFLYVFLCWPEDAAETCSLHVRPI